MQQYFANEKDNNILKLNEDDYNHIKNVMRYKTGDKILVVFDNNRYVCCLCDNLKECNILSSYEKIDKEKNITAYIPLTVENKMSFVLQKGAELGVDIFYVVFFKHSKFSLNNKDKEKKIKRWNEILRNASMQSQRINIPTVLNLINVNDIDICSNVNIMCSLDKNVVKPLNTILTNENSHDKINIVYGPEGGISKEEERLLIEKGYVPASLGNNVLRTETVLINIMSVINYLKGI